MIRGAFIAESLREGVELSGLGLRLTTLRRTGPVALSDEQKRRGLASSWTLIEFEADDAQAGQIADALCEALDEFGWYADFHSDTEVSIIFPGRVFRYRRGDAQGRERAAEFGRRLGVPEAQLDWGE